MPRFKFLSKVMHIISRKLYSKLGSEGASDNDKTYDELSQPDSRMSTEKSAPILPCDGRCAGTGSASSLGGSYPVATSAAMSLPATTSMIVPQQVYSGGYTGSGSRVRLRIASGGAGQNGLIAAWADAFIRYMVEVKHCEPFLVAWFLGDTTDSLGYLAAGVVDVAVTYNEAAEMQCLASGSATRRVYGFRDHFLLVGPKSNPAGLDPRKDDILTMFNKLVACGNADSLHPPDTSVRPPARFLSRFDKSATNIKESELFVKIGQVPWGLTYSKWYHQYPRFPQQALHAAAMLEEYTLTDRSTILSSPSSVMEKLEVFKAGGDEDPRDPLLNPGHVLLGSKAALGDVQIGTAFLDWVGESSGGRTIVRELRKNGELMYSEAPGSGV